MDVPLFIFGAAMIGVGIIISIVQVKALKAGKHKTGDFIVRFLINGIGLIVIGAIIMFKAFTEK